MKKNFYIISSLLLSCSINILAINDSTGIVTGNLRLDNTWETKVYLSVISNFDEMFTMKNKMIVSESPIDSLGNFCFNIQFLNEEESLLRIHVVKKGNPSTTLIIGGNDENHFFFIASNQSKIDIQNLWANSVFSKVLIKGSPSTYRFNQITGFSEYPELLNYDSTILEKKFVEDIVNERLRLFADTCKNALLSLYAIYKSEFEINYYENIDYYESYLKKWEKNKSTYFIAFRAHLPVKETNGLYMLTIFLLVLIGISIGLLSRLDKKRRFNKLSTQERRIFSLLKQGATNQQISDECHIELTTVKSHVSNIFSKLKIKSRKEVLNMK